MNLYIRYFNSETLVGNVDEALDFLASIKEIKLDDALVGDIREYAASDVCFPKRYKVRPRAYFIIIKTTASTMQDFKAKKTVSAAPKPPRQHTPSLPLPIQRLNEERPGWYEAQIDFKRVVMNHHTGKFEYRDTHVEYQCKAMSPADCYNRVIEHLRDRVDHRSQFPSVKGKSFKYKYLGKWK